MILKTFRSDDLRLKCLKISIAVKHKLCPRINVFTKLKKLSIYKTNSNSNNNSINNTFITEYYKMYRTKKFEK